MAFEPRTVQARLIELLHTSRKSCVTVGDVPYAKSSTLCLLKVLWDEVGTIFDFKDSEVIASFGPIPLS